MVPRLGAWGEVVLGRTIGTHHSLWILYLCASGVHLCVLV